MELRTRELTSEEFADLVVKNHCEFHKLPEDSDEITQLRHNWIVRDTVFQKRRKALIAKAVRQQLNGDEIKTQLITISIDKQLEEACAIEKQRKVIEKIKSAKYAWLQNASYTFEYFSGVEHQFNPHIHIKIDKTVRDSAIAQQLRRKLATEKSVYRINVSSKNDEIHSAYIMGNKKEDKRESVEADQQFREKYNIQDIYTIN